MNKRQAIKIYESRIKKVETYRNTMPEDRDPNYNEVQYNLDKWACEQALKVWRKRN